jgi:hypothetical protein
MNERGGTLMVVLLMAAASHGGNWYGIGERWREWDVIGRSKSVEANRGHGGKVTGSWSLIAALLSRTQKDGG